MAGLWTDGGPVDRALLRLRLTRTIEGMLRIAPSFSPLWRGPNSLQLGARGLVDQPVYLEEVSHWQERMLEALQGGIPDAMFSPLAESLGASPADAQSFAELLRPALRPPAAPAPVVSVEVPEDFGYGPTTALVDTLSVCGIRVEEVRSWQETHPGTVVMLVAHHLVDPRRAAGLVAHDVTHLPVEFAGDRARIGPLIVPGATACLACLHAHRRDADPLWPQLAAQLVRRAAPENRELLLEAALLSSRLLRTTPGEATPSVSISSGGARRVWRAHRAHPQCLCRSPAGSASVDDRDDPSPATTTATTYARPA